MIGLKQQYWQQKTKLFNIFSSNTSTVMNFKIIQITCKHLLLFNKISGFLMEM